MTSGLPGEITELENAGQCGRVVPAAETSAVGVAEPCPHRRAEPKIGAGADCGLEDQIRVLAGQ